MKHQYQSNYKPNEFLDVVDEFLNGKLKCQISTYSGRGRVKVKNYLDIQFLCLPLLPLSKQVEL